MESVDPCELRYESFAEEFFLSVITVKTDTEYYSHGERCVEILLCTEGNAVIKDLANNNSIVINKGRSILIPANVGKYCIEGNAVCYKASVPV
jgi:mannose-6-phosphate isomerase class I